jgi:hypothetical protein
MKITEKIKSLNLPFGEYVIIGSGILDVLNIRPAVDIDIAVLPDLYKKLKEIGEWKEREKHGKYCLEKETFEIATGASWGDYKPAMEELIASATIIEDIPFMNLDELIKFKIALGREKDFKDIELIKNYKSKSK